MSFKRENGIIDKELLLKRISAHDPVWEQPAESWGQGLLLGNGDLGVNIWGKGTPLVFSLDKADVWELRHWQPPEDMTWANNVEMMKKGLFSRNYCNEDGLKLFNGVWQANYPPLEPYPTRLPIGRLEIGFFNGIINNTMRLSLTDAMSTGIIKLKKGSVHWECYAASEQPVIIRLNSSEPGLVSSIRMRGYTSQDPISEEVRHMLKDIFQYPPLQTGKDGSTEYWAQPTGAGTEYGVVWKVHIVNENTSYLFISVYFDRNCTGEREKTIEYIKELNAENALEIREKHIAWWHEYYTRSGLFLPDTRLESLYWMETYKWACCTRPDKEPVSLVGVWAQDGIMPGWSGDYHWDTNVHLTYWHTYTANRMEYALPLHRFMERSRKLREELAQFIFHTDGEFFYGSNGLNGEPMWSWAPMNMYLYGLLWGCALLWKYYCYSLDEDFLHNTVHPTMKAALQPFIKKILVKQEDGFYHLPFSCTAEYWDKSGNYWCPDASEGLALLRTLLCALLKSEEILGIIDPQHDTWQEVLDHLAPIKCGEEGIWAFGSTSVEFGHRHHNYLNSIYPLRLYTLDKDEDLIARSLNHAISMGTGEWVGFSYTFLANQAAFGGYASLARTLLLDYLDHFVTESSLYFQGPVNKSAMTRWIHFTDWITLEAGFAYNDVLQNMLLHTKGEIIHVFPAMPQAWDEASFFGYRTEGACLVSAQRKNGKTVFMEVKTEKGGTIRIKTDLPSRFKIVSDEGIKDYLTENGILIFEMKPGETISLHTGGQAERKFVLPALKPHEKNFLGVKRKKRW